MASLMGKFIRSLTQTQSMNSHCKKDTIYCRRVIRLNDFQTANSATVPCCKKVTRLNAVRGLNDIYGCQTCFLLLFGRIFHFKYVNISVLNTYLMCTQSCTDVAISKLFLRKLYFFQMITAHGRCPS